METGSRRVGGTGGGKTPPAAGWVEMGLTDSRGFFELDVVANGRACQADRNCSLYVALTVMDGTFRLAAPLTIDQQTRDHLT